MLDVVATISIREMDGMSLVRREMFDSDGKYLGRMTDEEFNREVEPFKGTKFFTLHVMNLGQQLQVRSAISRPDASEIEMEEILESAMAKVGRMIAVGFRKHDEP